MCIDAELRSMTKNGGSRPSNLYLWACSRGLWGSDHRTNLSKTGSDRQTRCVMRRYNVTLFAETGTSSATQDRVMRHPEAQWSGVRCCPTHARHLAEHVWALTGCTFPSRCSCGCRGGEQRRQGLSDKRSFFPVPKRAGALPRLAAADMEAWPCFPFEARASLCRQERLWRGKVA